MIVFAVVDLATNRIVFRSRYEQDARIFALSGPSDEGYFIQQINVAGARRPRRGLRA